MAMQERKREKNDSSPKWGSTTGLEWDLMRQTINASNEWWDKKLKVCFVYSLNLFD